VDIVEKVLLKVKGQRSRSWPDRTL